MTETLEIGELGSIWAWWVNVFWLLDPSSSRRMSSSYGLATMRVLEKELPTFEHIIPHSQVVDYYWIWTSERNEKKKKIVSGLESNRKTHHRWNLKLWVPNLKAFDSYRRNNLLGRIKNLGKRFTYRTLTQTIERSQISFTETHKLITIDSIILTLICSSISNYENSRRLSDLVLCLIK